MNNTVSMSIFHKIYEKGKWQKWIVSLCFLFVCLGTQQIQTAKWDTGLIELSRDSLGIWMAFIIFTNYKWSDFVKYKRPYIVWTVVGLVLGVVFVPMALTSRERFLVADTIVIALGIFLMGYCVIHTLISFFVEKYRPKFYKPLIMIWVIMMVWMIFSKSEYLWPECYFVIFLCYYLTKQTPVQRTNVMNGAINGIILGFLCIQGHSLLCRPYDRVRYYGNFCNPNHNCMFLCVCLSAILAKILILTKNNAKRYVKIFFYLLAGVCYSFICMTVSRSGYLASFVVTVFFLIGFCAIKKKSMFIRMGALLVLLFVVLFPATYAAVRYIPTIHPHVLFYFQEGYSEERVHSWDPWDSEKFVSFESLLHQIFGRFAVLKVMPEDTVGEIEDKNTTNEIFLVSNTSLPSLGGAISVEGEKEETDPDKIPALTAQEAASAFMVRYTIYKWYITHLSMRGMPYDEQGFQLTSSHWIQDTHNIYLDYGINFGIPAMILFAIFIWWGIGRLAKQGIGNKDLKKLASLLFVLVPPIFGMFEFAWGAGMISTVVFYLCFKEIVQLD